MKRIVNFTRVRSVEVSGVSRIVPSKTPATAIAACEPSVSTRLTMLLRQMAAICAEDPECRGRRQIGPADQPEDAIPLRTDAEGRQPEYALLVLAPETEREIDQRGQSDSPEDPGRNA